MNYRASRGDGLYVGVPCVLGAGGVERVIESERSGDDKKAFDASVEHVRTLVGLQPSDQILHRSVRTGPEECLTQVG